MNRQSVPHGPGRGRTYEELRAAHIADRLGVSYRKALKVVREWNGMSRDEKKAYASTVDFAGDDDTGERLERRHAYA